MTTIKTVAERAGVSLKTVSRVLTAPETVSEKMRARVLAATEELNFVPDRRAQAMRSGRSGVIGLLTDLLASTPCSIDIVKGVEEALAERHMSLLVGNMENRSETAGSIPRSFRAGRVEGVIYAASYHREVDGFEPLHLPSIMVNCFSRDGGLPTVIPDEEMGGHSVGVHLIGLGHRHIAYLTLSPEIEATRLRLAGLARAMREAGMTVPDGLAVPGQSGAGAFVQEEAFVAAKALLSRPDRPTALFCGNDEMAMQVYNAAGQLGLAIPADLSVIGFDDHRLFSEGLRPGLTTVALPYVQMGRLAVEVLLGKPLGSGNSRVSMVDCPLVLRHSTMAAFARPGGVGSG
jgi:LacI family transcriptional regulator